MKKELTDNLNILNKNLKDSLEKKGYEPCLIGNLFYKNIQKNPYFYKGSLDSESIIKRERFSLAAEQSKAMFEIGLNGGHSSLLALHSNEDIIVYSNDIAKFYPPCPIAHPEVYVPEAAKTLKDIFKDRFNFIKGDCLIEVPRFVENNPELKFDLLHIDGEKTTYKRDFLNLLPLLKDNCLVIFDYFQKENVRWQVGELVKEGFLHKTEEFPRTMNQRLTNEILIYKK